MMRSVRLRMESDGTEQDETNAEIAQRFELEEIFIRTGVRTGVPQ